MAARPNYAIQQYEDWVNMRIGNWRSDATGPAYIIAEVGINHNGHLEWAHQMIDIAADCGADCVKFQTFHADQFCGDPDETFTYTSQGRQVTESMREMFRRVELPDDCWQDLAEHCAERNVDFMTTPQDVGDLELVLDLDLPALKVGSDDLVNTWLISRYSQTGLPMILSSGMAELDEIRNALLVAGWPENRSLAVLVCTSIYPAPPETTNLGRIATLVGEFPGLSVGFSDHTAGSTAAVIARSLGSSIFEKHFTQSHDSPGPDHWFSADPDELKDWIEAIRSVDVFVGTGVVAPAEAEIAMRRLARRGITALRDIDCGEILTEDNIGLRRPAEGISPAGFEQTLGRRARVPIAAWRPINESDLQEDEES